jgi:hypothetical protein
MKRIFALVMAMIMCLMAAACAAPEAPQQTQSVPEETKENIHDMIAIFGDDGDGSISKEEGSFPYFISHKSEYTLLFGAQIQEKIIGTWSLRDKFGDVYTYTFREDGTSTIVSNNGEKTGRWMVEDDFFYFGSSDRQIDTDQYTSMDVFQIEEGILILFENDTNSYNGMTYKMDYPYAVLVKE